jgi:PDDEXK-like domain of unknown function (DUF3799)
MLDYNLTSQQYHTTANTFSSSQLKTILEDPEKFYKEYVTKEIPRKESTAFDVGTYFHTAILEPHLLNEECAVFTGAIRRGKEWDAFKEQNLGKAIITNTELATATSMITAVNNSPRAKEYLDGFEREVSAFLEVYVFDGDIHYCDKEKNVYVLRRSGWRVDDSVERDDIIEYGVKLVIKVRADAICFKKQAISDLKSTTGNTKSEFFMRSKIDSYSYDLSASLYLDIFSAVSGVEMKEFAWIFASKDYGNSKTWIASQKNVMIGRSKWSCAVLELAKYVSNGWTFTDEIGILEPSYFQLEHLDKIKE